MHLPCEGYLALLPNNSTPPRLLQVDVLTVEIEHVDVDALETAAAQFSLDVEPTPHTLRLIQVLQMIKPIGCPHTWHCPVLLSTARVLKKWQQ